MDKNKSIIVQVKRIGLVGRKAGSKPISKLKKAIGRFDSNNYWEQKYIEFRKKS